MQDGDPHSIMDCEDLSVEPFGEYIDWTRCEG